MHRRPLVCITGTGIVTSLGNGNERNWQMLAQGRSGIAAIRRFETAGLPTGIGGTIDDDCLGELPFPLRTERLAERVIDEALAQAGLPKNGIAAMFAGLPPAEMCWAELLALLRNVAGSAKIAPQELVRPASDGSHRDKYSIYAIGASAMRIAEKYGARGAPVLVNTACSTGATVLELAVECIRRGEADTALAVAADASITPDALVRFGLLAALSMRKQSPESAARPFSLDRDGFVMGEGAAAMVLESVQAAKNRGASPLGLISWCRREIGSVSSHPLDSQRGSHCCGDQLGDFRCRACPR